MYFSQIIFREAIPSSFSFDTASFGSIGSSVINSQSFAASSANADSTSACARSRSGALILRICVLRRRLLSEWEESALAIFAVADEVSCNRWKQQSPARASKHATASLSPSVGFAGAEANVYMRASR
eukprot:4426458-Pleurochrysis_carterae.AAC.3